MRPRGVMPDWAAGGLVVDTDPAPGFEPRQRPAGRVNDILRKLRAFKSYRDALESLTWQRQSGLTAIGTLLVTNTPATSNDQSFIGDLGQYLAFDPLRQRYLVGGRELADPTVALLNFTSPPAAPGTNRADWQVCVGHDPTINLPAYVAWMNLRNGSDALVSVHTIRIYLTDVTPPIPDGVFNTADDTDLFVVGGFMFAADENRFYGFGRNASVLTHITSLLVDSSTGTAEPQTVEDPTGAIPRFGACATGHKVVSDGTYIWRTPNRFTPWKRRAVEDIMPGETSIKALFRAETDSVFVAVGGNSRVWTSPNGVQWSKTQAPTGEYTGAGCALGGTTVLVYKENNVYRLAIATNAFRTWRDIAAPVSRDSGNNPIQQLYAADGRLLALTLHGTGAQIWATMRLPT